MEEVGGEEEERVRFWVGEGRERESVVLGGLLCVCYLEWYKL